MLLINEDPSEEILQKIQELDISTLTQGRNWSMISAQGKDLVQQLMHKDTSRRITSESVLEHPWIVQRENLPEHHLQKCYIFATNLISPCFFCFKYNFCIRQQHGNFPCERQFCDDQPNYANIFELDLKFFFFSFTQISKTIAFARKKRTTTTTPAR